ncbi:ribulose-phosphate 3-epimerase [Cecembia lonarensis]|uniref:Ribulose-phosphate 3-epimerase n=1 Tax=Cecembia lonarensis (strain CCUG 58316 / KCTC 22772 / LW9) TaxID=1225176 RepID=K1KZ06_CECL9|nr:ribulose-phosphate 3-epimerase [Cecembia lonarensis]EKB49405.1 Ribulose-phosphate 3-epimerase [Cecembia lonarensis LW9]
MSVKIAPSILAADFANLQKEVEMLNTSSADYIHVDIMDGMFVPNISFGLPVTEAIHRHAAKLLDVHLMILDPDRYLPAFRKAGAEVLTVHIEACNHLHRTVQYIKDLGAKAGVALNPHTPVAALENILDDLDLVCLMSVNPGFGGQKFIQGTYDKIRKLRQMVNERGLSTMIEIDGGVNQTNAPLLMEAGADVLVAGSFVFTSPDPIHTIKNLKGL